MRKRLHELADLAYGRELSGVLKDLHAHFHEWEDGGLSCWDLNQKIHEFHQGVSRQVWKMYQGTDWDRMTARAIAQGFITREEAGEEVCGVLDDLIGMYGEVR